MLWVRISIRARCTTLCDKVCHWLATGRWFPPVSTANKTNRHGITETLLKVALTPSNKQTDILSRSWHPSIYLVWFHFISAVVYQNNWCSLLKYTARLHLNDKYRLHCKAVVKTYIVNLVRKRLFSGLTFTGSAHNQKIGKSNNLKVFGRKGLNRIAKFDYV